jgi:hypothetical protein
MQAAYDHELAQLSGTGHRSADDQALTQEIDRFKAAAEARWQAAQALHNMQLLAVDMQRQRDLHDGKGAIAGTAAAKAKADSDAGLVIARAQRLQAMQTAEAWRTKRLADHEQTSALAALAKEKDRKEDDSDDGANTQSPEVLAIKRRAVRVHALADAAIANAQIKANQAQSAALADAQRATGATVTVAPEPSGLEHKQ